MGKLSNDEIKFILTLEASGLQAEIGKTTAAVKEFAGANKALQAEMSSANKFLKESERQMITLEKAGKTNTSQYRELKETVAVTKSEIADYSNRIKENTQQIEKNNEIITKGIQSLKIEDMTMNQLKSRAKELKVQLDSTAQSSSPDEYKKLQTQLGQVDTRMSELKVSGKGMMSQLSSIPGPAGQVASSLMGMGKAMMALIANPVGAVIAAIVFVFMAFKKALNSSEEATEKLNAILAPLTKFLAFLLKILQDVVIGFLDFAEAALSGISKVLEKLPFIGGKMKEINEIAREAIRLERDKKELEKEEREWIVGKAQLENSIAINRDKAWQKDKYSVQERIGFLNEVLSAETKISEENVRQAKEKFRIAFLEASRSDQTEETKKHLKELQAAFIQSNTEMYNQRRGVLRQKSAFITEEANDAKTAAKEALQRQKDTLDAQLNDLESNYNERVTTIKKSGIEQSLTESQINLAISKESDKYYQDRIVALKEYLTKVKNEKLRSEITKKISENELALVENQKKTDELKLSVTKQGLDKNLKALDNSYSIQALVFNQALAEKKITQEQYDMLMMQLDNATADSRVKILEGYRDDVTELEIKSGELKKQAVDDANAQIISSETAAAQKRKAVYDAIVNSTTDFKSQFGLLTYDEEIKLQTKILDDVYKAKLEFLQKEGASTVELTAAYEQAKTNLILNSEKDRFSARQQAGIASWNEEYNIKIAELDQLHKAGLLSEEEYEKAKFKLKVENTKAYFDYFLGLGKNAVSAIMDAEISSMEATYDEKIAAAGDNAEEVTRLEKEKAQKKLDIEKKYADVNFAIKVAEIIANTAVAIMQGFAQLGPIGGAIAAVLMAVTGAAQVVSANAERRKVKAMTLEGGGGTSSQQRVVTGKEEGGYLEVTRAQDNKRFWARNSGKKRGYIDETSLLVSENGKEFIATGKAVSNPTIKPFLDIINNAQEGGYVEQLNMAAIMASSSPRGYETGGYPQSKSSQSAAIPIPINTTNEELLIEVRDLLKDLKKNGVKAPIVLSDLLKQMALEEQSNILASKS